MPIEAFDALCIIVIVLIASMISYARGYGAGIECFSMESYHRGKHRTMKEVSDSFKEEASDDIELTMTRADWKIFRKALRAYMPIEEEKQSYADLKCWIDTDWEDWVADE